MMPLFVLTITPSKTELHCPCFSRLTHSTHLQMFANCTFFNCSFVRGCVASPSLPSGRKCSCHKTSIVFGFDSSGSGRSFLSWVAMLQLALVWPGSPAAFIEKQDLLLLWQCKQQQSVESNHGTRRLASSCKAIPTFKYKIWKSSRIME